jgi:hypothetical protein
MKDRHEWPPLDTADERDWARFPGPALYRPAEIPASLRALASATAQTSKAAYDRFLFAIGNNHAGTLYPVAPACVPFLLGILANGTEWARWTALEVLIDALGFTAEPRFATVTREGATIHVEDAFVNAARAGRELFARLAADDAVRSDVRKSAADLCNGLEDASMFDWYEPSPPLSCPRCAAPLDGWQGKYATCDQWVWRQGHAAPIDQRVDPERRADREAGRLPARFEMHTLCAQGHHVEAIGDAPDGTWTRTTLVTAPVPPHRGANGRWSCPCCGCFTLDEEPPGTFQICPVCWWEDDRVQFDDPDFAGGANAPCLRRARFEYLFTGVADPDHRAHTRPPREDEMLLEDALEIAEARADDVRH